MGLFLTGWLPYSYKLIDTSSQSATFTLTLTGVEIIGLASKTTVLSTEHMQAVAAMEIGRLVLF